MDSRAASRTEADTDMDTRAESPTEADTDPLSDRALPWAEVCRMARRDTEAATAGPPPTTDGNSGDFTDAIVQRDM